MTRGKLIFRIGFRYGRLTVLAPAKRAANGAHWLCVCDCGNFKVARGTDLHQGQVKSCGCAWHTTYHPPRRKPVEPLGPLDLSPGHRAVNQRSYNLIKGYPP